jgi:hypothetical protein
MNHRLMLALAAIGMTSCATVQIPPDRLESSEASIRSADELGAQSVPAAKLHVQLARDQAAKAREMAADGDTRAEYVLARADADAELALGLAREAVVRREALAAAEELKVVRARGTP